MQDDNPSIEQIIPLLDEPGDKLIKAAHSVRNKQRLVEFAQSEVLRLQQEVEDSRQVLTILVNRNYNTSEIGNAVKVWKSSLEQCKQVCQNSFS